MASHHVAGQCVSLAVHGRIARSTVTRRSCARPGLPGGQRGGPQLTASANSSSKRSGSSNARAVASGVDQAPLSLCAGALPSLDAAPCFDREQFEQQLAAGELPALVASLEGFAAAAGAQSAAAAATHMERGSSSGDEHHAAERRGSHQRASGSDGGRANAANAGAGDAAAAAGRQALFAALRGQHQRLYRRLLREQGEQVQHEGRDGGAASATAPGGGLATRYLRLLPPEPRVWTSLMRECVQQGRPCALQALLVQRHASGLPPDAYSYSAAVGAAGRAGDLEAARAAFREALRRGVANTVLCNAAAGVFLRARDYEAVLDVCERMRQVGIQPDTITANQQLAAAGASGRTGTVRELLAGMVAAAAGTARNDEKGGQRWTAATAGAVPPTDAFTFSAAFRAAAAAPGAYSGDWLLATWRAMAGARVAPNEHVLTSFLSAASAAELSPDELRAVFGIASDCRAAGLCGARGYAGLLALCAQHGVAERALDVWCAVQEDDVRCTGRLYSALFSAAAAAATAAGRPQGQRSDMQDLVLRAYQHMCRTLLPQLAAAADHPRRHPQQKGASGRGRRGGSHDDGDDGGSLRVAFNALLHFFARTGEVGQAAAVYGAMRAPRARGGPGVAPDEVTYNTLIAAHGGAGDLEAAIGVFADMQRNGLVATPRTYTTLMAACARAGRRDVAARLLALMHAEGLAPAVQTYTALLDACVKDGSPEALELAFGVFDTMRSRGPAPTAVTYGCMLHACEATSNVERAFELYRQACEEGVLPTDECHNVLIKVCIRAKRLDEALDLVKSLARRHGSMQQPMLNSLIRALSGPYPDRALRLMSLMRTRHMEPNRGTFLALVSACAQDSNSAAALALYRQLRAVGHEPSGQAGSALITSLCRANDLATAIAVHDDMRRCAEGIQQQQHALPKRVCSGGGDAWPGGLHSRCLPQRSLLPTTSAVASLVEALTRDGRVPQALEYFSSISGDERRLAPTALTHRRMWESLIEACCRRDDIGAALGVFDKWKAVCVWLMRAAQPADGAGGQRFPSYHAAGGDAGSRKAGLSVRAQQQQLMHQQQQRQLQQQPVDSVDEVAGAAATHGVAIAAGSPAPPAAAPTAQRHPTISNVTLAFLEACCRRNPMHEWRVYDVCAEMRQAKERKVQAELARPRKASHHFYDSNATAADAAGNSSSSGDSGSAATA